jgi:hypothetical protein
MYAQLLKMLDVFTSKGAEPTMSEAEATAHGLFFETALTAADVDEAEGPHHEKR